MSIHDLQAEHKVLEFLEKSEAGQDINVQNIELETGLPLRLVYEALFDLKERAKRLGVACPYLRDTENRKRWHIIQVNPAWRERMKAT